MYEIEIISSEHRSSAQIAAKVDKIDTVIWPTWIFENIQPFALRNVVHLYPGTCCDIQWEHFSSVRKIYNFPESVFPKLLRFYLLTFAITLTRQQDNKFSKV